MNQNSSVGRTWEEVRQEMFTKEEVAESDLRVALIGEIVKARKEIGKISCIRTEISGSFDHSVIGFCLSEWWMESMYCFISL